MGFSVIFEEFFRAIWPIWWLWVPMAFWGLLYGWLYKDLWRHEADRKRVIGRLIQDKPVAPYRPLLTGMLDRVDARLSGPEVARGLGPGRVAFSSGLIQMTMLLAVAYPVLALAGQWVAGSPMLLGGVEVAPAGTGWARGYVVVWLGGLAVAVAALAQTAKLQRRWLYMAATAGFMILLFGSTALSFQSGVPATVAVAGAVAGAVAVIGAGAVAVAGAFAAAGAGAVAAAGAGAVAVVVTFAVTVAGAVAVTVGGAVAGAGALAVLTVENRRGADGRLWAVWLLAMGCGLAAVLLTRDAVVLPQDQMIIAFLGFLPILNALADFASVGLTRYLLRRGLAGWGPKYAALDIMGGAVIFALLGCTTIALFHWLRPQDGVPLLDLPGLFAGLAATPEHYWWLFVMLVSTLIPTLLHGMIGTFTLLLHYPPALRQWVVRRLDDGKSSDVSGRLGTAAWCAMLTLSVLVPIWLLWQALSYDRGALLRGIIAAFAAFARLIGAI